MIDLHCVVVSFRQVGCWFW